MKDQPSIWEERHAGGWQGEAARSVSDFCLSLAARLPRASAVLELGCGTGDDAAHLASLGHDVLATDVASSAVDKARRRHAGVPGLRFEQHDTSEPFDLPDASIDAVYARLSLHYFRQAQTTAVFAELARLLRPGGLFAFMCKSPDDPLYGKGAELEPEVYESSHLRHFFSQAYARELLAPSFEVESIASKQGVLYESPSAWIEVIARRR